MHPPLCGGGVLTFEEEINPTTEAYSQITVHSSLSTTAQEIKQYTSSDIVLYDLQFETTKPVVLAFPYAISSWVTSVSRGSLYNGNIYTTGKTLFQGSLYINSNLDDKYIISKNETFTVEATSTQNVLEITKYGQIFIQEFDILPRGLTYNMRYVPSTHNNSVIPMDINSISTQVYDNDQSTVFIPVKNKFNFNITIKNCNITTTSNYYTNSSYPTYFYVYAQTKQPTRKIAKYSLS